MDVLTSPKEMASRACLDKPEGDGQPGCRLECEMDDEQSAPQLPAASTGQQQSSQDLETFKPRRPEDRA